MIVGDSGGAADTVRHGETGYLVDPYNPVATAVRLIELLTDPGSGTGDGRGGSRVGGDRVDLGALGPAARGNCWTSR